MLEDFFKVPPTNMKVQPDDKWPHTTSKGYASLVDSSCCHGKCKQANEFQEHHHGQYMEYILVMTFCVNFVLELLQIPRQCFTVVLTKLTMFQSNLDLFQAYNNWNSYTAPCIVNSYMSIKLQKYCPGICEAQLQCIS